MELVFSPAVCPQATLPEALDLAKEAGFGRIETLDAEEILLPEQTEMTRPETEMDILSHMNTDHSDAVSLYANELLDAGTGDWTLTAIDPDGIDLADGERALRYPFDREVLSAEDARGVLVEMAKTARG